MAFKPNCVMAVSRFALAAAAVVAAGSGAAGALGAFLPILNSF
jgi:hypothetical protein